MISLINRLIQSPTLSQKGKSIFNLLLNVLYITKEPNLTFNQIDGQLYSAINWIIPLLYLKYAKIMVYLWIIIFHWSILSSLCPNYLNFPKAASWHIFICSGNTTLSSLFILSFVKRGNWSSKMINTWRRSHSQECLATRRLLPPLCHVSPQLLPLINSQFDQKSHKQKHSCWTRSVIGGRLGVLVGQREKGPDSHSILSPSNPSKRRYVTQYVLTMMNKRYQFPMYTRGLNSSQMKKKKTQKYQPG